MPNAQEILQLMQSRRFDNLEYFKKYQPKLYGAFAEYELTNAKINISPDGKDINLIVDGKPLYKENYMATGQREFEIFSNNFKRNKVITHANTPDTSIYYLPRFFHQLAVSLGNFSPSGNGQPMIARNNYPLVVVTGIGLGGHIEQLCNQAQVNHLIIFEPNPDVFAASLYTLDWKSIFSSRSKDPYLSIDIVVGNINEEETKFSTIWNKLVKFNPLFPSSTYFLNHLGDETNLKLIRRFNKDISVFYSVWGFWDDELNQLNQCLHNLNYGYKVLQKAAPSNRSTPVFIVGAGPSLDTRIEDIKKYKDDAIIISCGTALKSLHYHGITPDFHVELESHRLVVDVLEAINDPSYLKTITLISVSNVHPDVINLFKDSLAYFKAESSLWGLFGEGHSIIPLGTPTCTNAALAFCYYYGLQNVSLFGCDYGFRDAKNHHATGSVYYNDNYTEAVENNNRNHIKVTDVYGNSILSTNILFTSLRTIEKLAQFYLKKNVQIRNCSEGADIQHTVFTSSDKLAVHISEITENNNKTGFIEDLHTNSKKIDKDIILHGLEDLSKGLQELFDNFDRIAFDKKNDFEQTVYLINYELEQKFPKKYPAYYWIIRGSIWHLCYLFYTHQLTTTDDKKQAVFTKKFRKALKLFKQEVVSELDMLHNKSFDSSDPWLKVPIEVLPEGEEINIKL